MCFYFATLVNPYGIGLIIYGNSCHFITVHVFIGALQLITQPYCVHSDNKHRSTETLCFLHL